jgi:pilus assembly protein CpaC
MDRELIGRRALQVITARYSFTSLLLTILLGALTIPAHAAGDSSPRKEIFVTINAGESYVITGLNDDSTPAIHVLDNPHALVIHSDKPGEVVLLGAEAGQWAIDVTDSSGQALRYKVRVNAIANPFTNPLEPGTTPPALGSPHFNSAAGHTVTVAALDPAAGLAPAAAALPASSGASSPVASTSASGPGSSAGVSSMPPLPSSAVVAASASTSMAPPPSPADPSSYGGKSAIAANSAAPGTASAEPAAASANPPPDPPMASSPMLTTQSEPGEVQQFRNNPSIRPRTPSVSGGDHFLPDDVVELSAGSSRIIDFERRIRRISIADTEVADVQVITPFQINLIGHKEGFTTLAIWDLNGNYDERQIRVDAYGKQQVMLNVIVAELDRSRLEQQGINWAMSMPNQGISLVGLPGTVATPYNPTVSLTPQEVLGAGSPTQTVVASTAPGTLPLAGQLIPLLLSSTLNYGLAAGNSNFQTQFFFQALENHNFAKILAEPRLLANSGEKAEFLSGGEIPIVVAQALNTSIVFKKFGTSVVFVPTVIGSDDIQLEVMPEVSQPDYAHSVQLFGFSVPAFVTRTARTSVRLKNRQTLIIAGLILHTKTSIVEKTPYLGDIPYLGALFKTTSYNDQENDLVMTVTPEIVAPIPVNGVAAYPTDRGPLSPAEIQTQPVYPTDASRPRF